MDELYIASWNVRGLTDPHRKYLVRNWLASLERQLDILLLQEVKVDNFWLDVTLRFLLPTYSSVIAYPDLSKGGTVILIHPDFEILNSGTSIVSRIPWAELQSRKGKFSISNIYAPNISLDRLNLWKNLQNTLPRGNWIMAGDYNMTENREDSTSNSPLISGNKLNEWRLLKNRFSLIDVKQLTSLNGPTYTRRGTLYERQIQSRLDRFYISDQGNWLTSIKELKHHTNTVLSDHEPITIKLTIKEPNANNLNLRRSTYFKADPVILLKKENISSLKAAWQHKTESQDIFTNFKLAKQRF
jgi:exonuclease III